MINILLITPPFTQLNTPYPATAYLKGFLDEQGIPANQCDLSIELFNKIFTKDFITLLFKQAEHEGNLQFPMVWQQRSEYIAKVDRVLGFLRTHQVTEAYQTLSNGYLPKSHRYCKHPEELERAFGNLGVLDKAKHLATLFIEELGDFIRANVDEFFSFTRYAEQIATSASSFDKIDEFLCYEPTLIEEQLLLLLGEKIKQYSPSLVCFTIPFPGNLFSALRCAQFIKHSSSTIKVAFGGGYCNTELLSLTDSRIFKFIDFMTTGDGEGPLLKLAGYLSNKNTLEDLERTYCLENGKVVYKNKKPNSLHPHSKLPAPSYKGLPHQAYVAFLDRMNPMHRLWTDGKWNKLTIAHGCYWKQCSFCDVGLSYIADYQNTTAQDLVDKIKKVIKETGTYGFHFVDEAAPPKMLKAMAETLLKQKVHITWWTNIRFEKTFTPELCRLMAKAGCIAVTGGLEVASDRLLEKMNKGVDIKQVAQVTHAFTQQNIMVHAYLMYGFPTQTSHETIDSLEIVRQLFANNCIQSAFWHQFTTTVHSPVGKSPESFGITISGPKFKGFARNDLWHQDPTGANHAKFKTGLNKALSHYLNGEGFDIDLQKWFDFEITPTSHPLNFIKSILL